MASRIAQVVEYDWTWEEAFSQECECLKQIIGDNCIDIYHIGSTAVPGLCAKPTIDILMVAGSLSLIDKQAKILANEGYSAKGENGIAGRRYFVKGKPGRTHQLHVYAAKNPNIIRHVAFRDYLRNNKDVAKQYARIKVEAINMSGGDPEKYYEIKSEFVANIERLALAALNH
jgi:GrpB-like predicted nucleotidyltransferase (UPF0157 family)